VSNRATRRADLADFKRCAHRAHLVTFLIEASDDVSLDRHPLLSRALAFWRSNIMQRRPFCPACRSNYADGAIAAAFLFSTPADAPTSASVSAFCEQCWHDLTITEIERISARVLQAVVPGGRFLDRGASP
jgi:hypothetical protein